MAILANHPGGLAPVLIVELLLATDSEHSGSQRLAKIATSPSSYRSDLTPQTKRSPFLDHSTNRESSYNHFIIIIIKTLFNNYKIIVKKNC